MILTMGMRWPLASMTRLITGEITATETSLCTTAERRGLWPGSVPSIRSGLSLRMIIIISVNIRTPIIEETESTVERELLSRDQSRRFRMSDGVQVTLNIAFCVLFSSVRSSWSNNAFLSVFQALNFLYSSSNIQAIFSALLALMLNQKDRA